MAIQETSNAQGTAAVTATNTAGGPAVLGQSDDSTGIGVQGASVNGSGVTGESINGTGTLGVSTDGPGTRGDSTKHDGVQGVSGDANRSGVYGENRGAGWGVFGRTNSTKRAGVEGENGGDGSGVKGTGMTGVVGESPHPAGVGVRGYVNQPSGIGVFGISPSGTGVRGQTDIGHGVLGETIGGIAVHGIKTGDGGGLAGAFEGNVVVHGTLTKSAGAFLIDHPLDPANKYLRHSFVESPDMLNIYNGIAVLDDSGEASVSLPSWFDALNGGFRYGLTPIGRPAPNLYIAEEVQDNRFKIAGGSPGMKVSWQITGVRRDPYAAQNPILVEEDKPESERGKYLHPKEHGLAESMAIH